jgi:arylsulfatase A-like enzyme
MPPESMATPAVDERPISVLALALWAGIVTGFAELAKVGLDLLHSDFIYRSRDALWMIPAFDAGLFALVGLVLVLVGLRIRVPCSVAAGVFAGLGTVLVLLLVERLHGAAALVVAAGVGTQTARAVQSRVAAVSRVVRRTLPWLTGAVAVIAVATVGWRIVAERRMADARPAAARGVPNVLLLILDTVRAADLSLYGYARRTTPELERLGERATVFDRAFSAAPWTLPSHASIFTGQWELDLNVSAQERLGPEYPTLAEALHARGYATAAFVSNARYAGWESGFTQGFELYDDHPITLWTAHNTTAWGTILYWRLRRMVAPWLHHLPLFWRLRLPPADRHRSAEDISRRFLAWLDRDRPKPFFAFLNFMDAHIPYTAPDSFRYRFRSPVVRPLSPWAWSTSPPVRLTPADLRPKQDMYDGSIAYLDSQLGQLFRELDRRGLLDNTLVIVTSDHGEEFAEHGAVDHGSTLYRFSLQVPLLLRLPGAVPAGRRVVQPVSLRNLAATVLDLAGPGDTKLPGRSLARLWLPGGDASADTIVASVRQSEGRRLLSIAFQEWRYIRDESARSEALYHFPTDRLERWNMVDSASGSPLLERYRAALTALKSDTGGQPLSEKANPAAMSRPAND